MGLIKEPEEVDFIIESEPWTEKELADFRKLMKREKLRQSKKNHHLNIPNNPMQRPPLIFFLLLPLSVMAQSSKIKTQPVDKLTTAERAHLIEEVKKEDRYDEKVKLLKVYRDAESNHYHSTLVGQDVHPFRNSIYYASELLDTQVPAYQQRAFQIIEQVIAHQDQDAERETYGIWPYNYEEPLEEMAKPDWNWADFISKALIEDYINHADVLPADLQAKMKQSIIHAAHSIQRRDVKPGYTNIAIMGTFVTYVASHLFDLPDMQAYADMRLKRFYDYTVALGGFAEYNSPTYTRVALDELARMQKYITDREALRMVDVCYRTGWQGLARHFHPPSAQLAGPHSRSYATLLRDDFYDFLYSASDGKIAYGEAKKTVEYYLLPHQIPKDMLKNFQTLDQVKVSVDTFSLDKPYVVGYTYLHSSYTLGTVSRSNTWEQRRPYVAYWGSPEQPKYFRVRLLHDFVDFATGQIFSQQQEAEALTALCFATNGGDYHTSLDRLEGGKFKAKDLRLRFELSDAAMLDKLKLQDQTFSLKDQNVDLRVKMLMAQFGDLPLKVEKGKDEESAYVDWIIYSGEERHFDLSALQEAIFAWATSFDEGSNVKKAKATPKGNLVNLQWNELKLSVPLKPDTQDALQESL